MAGNKKGKFGIALLVIGALAGLAYFLVKITNHRKIVFSSTPVMEDVYKRQPHWYPCFSRYGT